MFLSLKTLPHSDSTLGVAVFLSLKTLPHSDSTLGVAVFLSLKTLPHSDSTLSVAVFLSLKTLPHSSFARRNVTHPPSLRVKSRPGLCCCRLICDLVPSSCRSQASRFESCGAFWTLSPTPVERSSLRTRASLREDLYRVAQGLNNPVLTGRRLTSPVSLTVLSCEFPSSFPR